MYTGAHTRLVSMQDTCTHAHTQAAYEAAGSIATEGLSAIRTVASFGGEVGLAKRYESNLVTASRGESVARLAMPHRWRGARRQAGRPLMWRGSAVSQGAIAAHNPRPKRRPSVPRWAWGFRRACCGLSCSRFTVVVCTGGRGGLRKRSPQPPYARNGGSAVPYQSRGGRYKTPIRRWRPVSQTAPWYRKATGRLALHAV